MERKTRNTPGVAERECVSDARSCVGLMDLVRAHPDTWRTILCDGARCRRKPLTESTTLAELLAGGHFDLGLPRTRVTPASVKRDRGCSRRVSAANGDLVVAACTEKELRKRQVQHVRKHRRLTRELLRRELCLLRRVVWTAQKELGKLLVERYVYLRIPDRQVLAPRVAPSPAMVAAVLAALSDARARVAVALAAGAGLLEGEILRLRRRNLAVAGNALWIDVEGARVRGHRGRRSHRWFAVPPWVADLVVSAFPEADGMRPDALLFPGRKPDRPRTSYGRIVATACDRAAVPRLTLGNLRRLYQLVMRVNRGPRCAVRGTMWRMRAPADDVRAQHQYAALVNPITLRWAALAHPPGLNPTTTWRMPRSAPKDTGALDPEIRGRRSKRGPPLPPSCAAPTMGRR